MEKVASKPEAAKEAEAKRQSEIGYLLSVRKLLNSIGGFDPEYSKKELPKVEKRLGELGVNLEEPVKPQEAPAEAQKAASIAAEKPQETPVLEKPALPKLEEAEKEKVELSWKDKFKSKFSASIRAFMDAFDVDKILWDARVKIQKRFKEAREKKLGEELVGGVVHSHSAKGSKYIGSDGAVPIEMIGRVVKAAGGSFVIQTDHDVFKPEDLFRLEEAAEKSNKSQNAVTIFCGTEMTSARKGESGELNKGHIVVWSIGKPLVNDEVPGLEPNLTPVEIAEWAFKNGHGVLIPHPNSRRRDLRVFDISLEREDVIEILKLAEKYDKRVLIASRNGTTGDDYKERMLGSREHFWQFWRTPMLGPREEKLFEKRARFIVEADAHIPCEFPQFVYFMKKDIVDVSGKISQQKIYEALCAGRYEVKWADEDFNSMLKLAKGAGFFEEYARLIYVWLGKLSRGEVYQFNTEPRRNMAAVQKKVAAMPE